MAAALAEHIGIEGDITYSTDDGLIEIVPLGISKATGVEELARPLGITADDVVAFGDMPNDVPMLLVGGPRRRDGQRAPGGARGGQRGDRAQHQRRGGAGAGTLVAVNLLCARSSAVDRGEPLDLWRAGLSATAAAARRRARRSPGSPAAFPGRSSASRAGSSARSTPARRSRRWSAGPAGCARSRAPPRRHRSRRRRDWPRSAATSTPRRAGSARSGRLLRPVTPATSAHRASRSWRPWTCQRA